MNVGCMMHVRPPKRSHFFNKRLKTRNSYNKIRNRTRHGFPNSLDIFYFIKSDFSKLLIMYIITFQRLYESKTKVVS